MTKRPGPAPRVFFKNPPDDRQLRAQIVIALMETFAKYEADSSWPNGRYVTLANAVMVAIAPKVAP